MLLLVADGLALSHFDSELKNSYALEAFDLIGKLSQSPYHFASLGYLRNFHLELLQSWLFESK